jgi:DNA-binding FrmR family transcriptional regulator
MEKKDRTIELNLIKTARGQLDGIVKMLEDDRYCIDISKQILSVQGLLKKTNLEILKKHMNSCVKEAFEEGNGEEKIDEIMLVLNKYYKN